MSHDTFIVVPAYNEAPALAGALAPLFAAGYSVVVVDDGSTDETRQVASALPAYVLRHPINLGQGAALQTGTTFALRCGAAYVVHFDADGQHQAADVVRLVAPLRAGEADVALGSRFLRPEDSAQAPALRRWLLRAGTIVNGLLTGMWLSDAHNGLRAFTRAAASQIDLRENRQAHASEILSLIRRAKLRYVECPVTIRYTPYSRAKGQSGWNAFNIVFDLLTGKMLR